MVRAASDIDQNDQGLLRRTSSDVSVEIIGNLKRELGIFSSSKNNNLSTIDEVKQAECECCGMKEECTQAYIAKVEDSFSGKWVCGLCSEAVKERMKRSAQKSIAIEEAVSSHRDVCQKFNNTRLNPKLSLTFAMRDIAKRSEESRISRNSSCTPKLTRRSSCVPRIK
ncbi:uncharacterized protein LOC126784298 [Argentina anserina]|uniref:uncharacterized protein LOC126784298 n=1 Tax=Argentina anserina TaxID=57926 RepID=UPI0021762583|nr:uncharacterized protein LOC126784298 [Potentilla anserina]